MKSNTFLLSMLTVFSVCSGAFAGESGAHGGNAVACPGQPAVVLDYYNAMLPTVGNPNGPRLIDVDQMSTQAVIEYVKAKLSKTALAKDFDNALEEIGPIESWTATASADLKDTGDSNEAYNLPINCSKLQAAARQGSIVYGDPKVIALLSEGQRGILVVHEVLYYIAENQKGAKTSEQVRPLIRTLLNTSSADEDIFKAVNRFGYYEFGLLAGHDYQLSDPEYCEIRFSEANFSSRTLIASYFYHDASSSRANYCANLSPVKFHCDTDGVTCHNSERTLVMLNHQASEIQISYQSSKPKTYRKFD